MTTGTHALTSVETHATEDQYRAWCACGWTTGWNRERHVAVRAVGSHTDQESGMTEVRASAILRDHAEGLHDDHDEVGGCGWPGCTDAYWLLVRVEEQAIVLRDALELQREVAVWRARESISKDTPDLGLYGAG